MIETKLFFMNEVSDLTPCNHSMLIVSNHSFINVLVLHFHFFCLILYLLWAVTMRLCQAISYTFCYFFFFNADILFSLLCRDFAAV